MTVATDLVAMVVVRKVEKAAEAVAVEEMVWGQALEGLAGSSG